MPLLQFITIAILFVIVVISVIVGTRAHQKEREVTERRFKQLQLMNRADRVQHHIAGLKNLNTDAIVTDVLYDFYIDTLRDLMNYSDQPDEIELRISKAEEERNDDLVEFTTTPHSYSFQEKSKYKERLTKAAKLLLYMRRKGRISHSHYKACYDYIRWLNLWLQLNRQLVQANNNFTSGDMRVAQSLYSVIMSHLKATSIDRPERHEAIRYVDSQIKSILKPPIVAIQESDNPDDMVADLVLDFDETPDEQLIDEKNNPN
ncbi:DNA topoisomerase I [Marinomonas sp. 15G1-11]|uniref:DNA topoisomerase I n=1 Tax=Marinomonas phaeophyticola TaxID=3004091 RepID=A0ABT4JPY5_9GAMM|nr:DNA topoisomerase I [Marinomonas sp. 15G1-11]MCZ2720445.1 DNA topoisomerase I [Marinomonas sp. 15G1-11]